MTVSTAIAAETDSGPLFEQYEVSTGPARHQTLLTGYFLDRDTAEIAVVQNDKYNRRQLTLYGLDHDEWLPVLNASLGQDVLFVDVANIGGLDRLISYDGNQVRLFDPDTKTERPVVSVATHYDAMGTDYIPHLDISRDINHDGRDDLVLPDIDGFRVAIQNGDGSFADVAQLGPPEPFREAPGLADSGIDESRTYGDVGITVFTAPLYASRVHEMDHNQDGLSDLVFWNGKHFDVHYQTSSGSFTKAPAALATSVAFDADGVYTHAFEYSGAGLFTLLFGTGKKIERTMLHSMRDMDGDAIADLVTLTLAGRSPFKQRSVYNIHFGTATPDGVTFSTAPDTTIHPRGKAGGAQLWGYGSRTFTDIDGDGKIDLMLRDVKLGFGSMIRAMAAKSVVVDLEFFRMTRENYPDKADFVHRIRTRGSSSDGKAPFFPAVLLGDINDDGRADLLVGSEQRSALNVFIGVPGPALFDPTAQKVEVEMPVDGEHAWLTDLNADGRQDVIMHHRSETGPHRLVVLLARQGPGVQANQSVTSVGVPLMR